jgi:hypothetical protein
MESDAVPNPEMTDQLAPLFVERENPTPWVPQKILEPAAPRAEMVELERPLLEGLQLPPLLFVTKTPPPRVPA